MDFADCLSAFEDFLRTKEIFRCSSGEIDSFLQTLPITEETRYLVKKTIMENPPATLEVHNQTVSLSSCYIDSIKQTQDVLQKDRTGKLSQIMRQMQKSLSHTQRTMFKEISTILEISGNDRVSVRICEQKQRSCEAKVKMRRYLLLEGLQDVMACISAIGNSSLEDVWKLYKTSSDPLVMQIVGMDQSTFEKTLKGYPEAFQVEDGKVFLKDNPNITYSLILCHLQSAQHKLKDHLYNQGALLKKDLFHSASQLLSIAEILAMGQGLNTFTDTLQSLRNDFLLIPPHMLVVAQGTTQVQDNPFVSAVSKIKDFIKGENAGNGTLMSQLLRVVNKTLGPCEQAAVGNTSERLRETIAAYPGHFIIGHDTVFVESDDAFLLDVTNIKMQNLPMTKIDQEISSSDCSSNQYTESFEDSAHSDLLDQETGSSRTDNDVWSSVQYTEQSESSANSDAPYCDESLPCTDNDVCSSIQNTEHDVDLSNSVTPDQDTGSSRTDNDVCSSVQNTEHSEDFANSDPSNQGTASPDVVCSSIQNTEHEEDLPNSVTPDQYTGSPHTNDGVYSSIHDMEHPEVLENFETPDRDTGSPCTDDDVCSSVQNIEHDEGLANSEPSHHDSVSLDADYDTCTSVRKTQHSEDFPNSDAPEDTTSPDTDNDKHACSSDQTPSLGQDEVESLGSEIISDSESLHSGTSSEAGNLDPDIALSESTDQEIVTILQDLNYFGELIKEFLSKATYLILSVSLSDGWLIAGLWDGPTFATCLTPSSSDQQQILGPSERIALDFLTSKSILKVVFDGKQLTEINDALGIEIVKVFDLKEAERLITPGSKSSRTLPESLNFFGVDPCRTVEVCIGTIQAPVYGEVYSEEAILKLMETARWTMKQVPYLYQKMLGLMKPYQITKVSILYDDEVEDQPFTSSQKEEPCCSTITSSRSSPVTSSTSAKASKNFNPDMSSSGMGSQVHVPVTSSTKAKATSEMPVSVHRVSSTSGDLDEPDSKGQAQSSDDLLDTEENLQSDLLSGPEVDADFLIKDNRSRTTSRSSRSRTTSPSSRSRTTSRRSKKMQTTEKQEESSQQATEGSGSTPSPMADEGGTSEQLSYMVNAKVLHYDDAGKPILISCANELANKVINPCQISHELSKDFGEIVMHDQEKFLEAFGICMKYNLKKLSESDESLAIDQLTEVVMDLGRKPSARYYQPGNPGQLKIKTIGDNQLTKQDLKDILEGHCSPVSSDHRSTIKGTLHRVGIMCNRQNEPIGLTTLTKHAVLGCATPLFDLMNQGQSILFVGSPGVGKSTILREAARVINDVVMRRVVIVDTCNEIAGDGDIPHPAVGGARRVQLPDRDSQPNMIREVVRNHSPHTLVIDEVVTEADAAAVHVTRERGIQVISAAPGQTLQDVILNPKLRHLFGGIQNMAMSHPGQGINGHTVMQRTQPAAFDILVEMYDRYRWIVHTDFTRSIDLCLRKEQVSVQERRGCMKQVSKDSQGIPQVLVRDLLVMYPL